MPDRHYGSEATRVAAATSPLTRARIADGLALLGVRSGATLLVHSSLGALGWVAGGAHAVVLALLDALGPDGTLVMPTHTGHLSDPARWRAPPVPEAWWPVIRAETPAFDPVLTPTRDMGAIVEAFRHVPGVLRSAHPLTSFAAVGPAARHIVDDHRLGSGLGEHSPLARLYELDALVLLLGVGHANNTSLHLAEYRAAFAGKVTHTEGAPILTAAGRQWVEFDELKWHDDDFATIGEAFASTGAEVATPIGSATARLMPQRAVVDFGVAWMETHRR